jgi:UDP-N-acetylglucosamine 1-carboxyvinyltransferase
VIHESDAQQSGNFIVSPNGPLHGAIDAGGAKNSVLKLMAACLLAEGTNVLQNVPYIQDVAIMSELLEAIGAKVYRRGHNNAAPGTGEGTASADDDLIIETPTTILPEAPYELVEKIRASIVVLGPLAGRMGRVKLPLPGGDDFGERPVDMHIDSLSLMGAQFKSTRGCIEATVPEGRLTGTRIVLEYPSHTATDNILMAAVLANGTTVIENAAREPEVVDLAAMLSSMGARIKGAGTSRVTVEGVPTLHPAMHRAIADRVVAATFAAAVGIAGGDVTIRDARMDHMDMIVRKMTQMGLRISHSLPQSHPGIRIYRDGGIRLHSVDVSTLPYPGVATDYAPFIVAMLSIADGVGIVSENLFSGRFRYVDELIRLGANISTEGHHAVIRGADRLQGALIKAPDIRGGAALVLAGLVAEGETVVTNTMHIDRGYEDFAGKLASLGANIQRTSTE